MTLADFWDYVFCVIIFSTFLAFVFLMFHLGFNTKYAKNLTCSLKNPDLRLGFGEKLIFFLGALFIICSLTIGVASFISPATNYAPAGLFALCTLLAIPVTYVIATRTVRSFATDLDHKALSLELENVIRINRAAADVDGLKEIRSEIGNKIEAIEKTIAATGKNDKDRQRQAVLALLPSYKTILTLCDENIARAAELCEKRGDAPNLQKSGAV